MKRQLQKALHIAVLIGFASGVNASDTRPNIVIILADDLGWNDVGYHGSEILTPHIDQLAAEGLVLERFYAQTSCTPTRAALLTGKSPQALGIYSPFSKHISTGLPLSEKLLPEYFQGLGYQTVMVGKWHLGFRQPDYHPLARGFEHFYGNLTGGIGYWDHVHGGGLDWQRNGVTVREAGYATRLSIDEIERLISDRDPAKPFFLYAAFNAPHLPNEAPADAVARYTHLEDINRRRHAAMVSELDAAIGRLTARLEREGILDNTLIWFMSDNGGLNASAVPPALLSFSQFLERWFETPFAPGTLEFIRTNSLDGASDNTPFRKGKQSVYEGGARVPAIIHWPSRLQGREYPQMVTVLDVLPTLLAVADASEGEPATTKAVALAGVNHWAAFTGTSEIAPKGYFITGMDGEAFYQFPWKLIALKGGGTELYNIAQDPMEQQDLSDQLPEQLAIMMNEFKAVERGESIHTPLLHSLWDMDFFGGEEDRPPWSELTEPSVDSR